MLNPEINYKIIKECIFLKEFGYNDFAWDKDNARKLINSILNDNIGILGGDVYRLIDKQLEPLIDNWACEPRSNESRASFYLRSKIESLSYIEKYPNETGIIFSIVFTEPIYLENF